MSLAGSSDCFSSSVASSPQDAVVRESAGDPGGEVGLGLLVGSCDWVALLVVLELHFYPAAEVAGQDLPGATGEFHGVSLDFDDLRFVQGLHDFTLTPTLSLKGEGESLVRTYNWPTCGKGRAAPADGQPRVMAAGNGWYNPAS